MYGWIIAQFLVIFSTPMHVHGTYAVLMHLTYYFHGFWLVQATSKCILYECVFIYFFSHKKELPGLITIGNRFLNKETENKSNLLLQDQLNKCNKLIDVLRQENIQQKSEVFIINIWIISSKTNLKVYTIMYIYYLLQISYFKHLS